MHRVAAAVAAMLALSAPAVAHPPGVCVPTERCETWSATYDDPAVPADRRSDQSVFAVLANDTTVFTVVRSVAELSSDPAMKTATANVVAHDLATGAVRWTTRQHEGWYNMAEHAVLSPDGTVLYVTGTSYDDNIFAWTDTHIVTTAYATGTGATLWSATWDSVPNTRDSGNDIAVAPDGSEVYVVGYSNGDFVTIAYGADGHELWSQAYGTPGEVDEPYGVAVAPGGDVLAVTGMTGGMTQTSDATTVAYSLRGPGGRQLWAATYKGIDAGQSDHASAIAADADRFYVTGGSYGGPSGSEYATLAYDKRTGAQVWEGRWSGGGGFDTATEVAVANGRVVVTGRASVPANDAEFDAATVAYEAETGRELWAARFAPARHDGSPMGLALSAGGETAYVVTREEPYLTVNLWPRLGLVAYDVTTGAERWHSFLDSVGGSLAAAGVAVGGGSVAVAGTMSQRTDDAFTAVFPE